ncbi:MAG: hypothetical protein ACK47V_05980, partial [Betaproteobacteria bacterium]
LEGRMQIDPAYATDVRQARQAAEAIVDGTIGPYVSLKNGLQRGAGGRACCAKSEPSAATIGAGALGASPGTAGPGG